MAPVELPYLQVYRSRGKLFIYYRRGAYRVRLEGRQAQPHSSGPTRAPISHTRKLRPRTREATGERLEL